MTDKEKAELAYKTLTFVKSLTDDPIAQSEVLLNANSMLNNSIHVDALRSIVLGMFK